MSLERGGEAGLGSFGADAFGLRAPDDQLWHRHLDEAADPHLAQFRPPQDGPAYQPDSIGEGLIEASDVVPHLLEFYPR